MNLTWNRYNIWSSWKFELKVIFIVLSIYNCIVLDFIFWIIKKVKVSLDPRVQQSFPVSSEVHELCFPFFYVHDVDSHDFIDDGVQVNHECIAVFLDVTSWSFSEYLLKFFTQEFFKNFNGAVKQVAQVGLFEFF